MYNVGKTIPECDAMLEIYSERDTSHGVWCGDELPEEGIDNAKEVFQDWLDTDDYVNILRRLQSLKKHQAPAFIYMRDFVDLKYKGYFNHLPNGIPRVFAQPSVIFSVVSRSAGSRLVRGEWVVAETSSVKVTMVGIVPYGRDYQTIHALVSMMMDQAGELECREDMYVGFTTTLLAICKHMKCKNPSDKLSQAAVFQSLRRLRGCIITWYYKKEKRHNEIGGILSKVRKLRDGSDNIFIDFDVDFIRLFKKGYINIDPDIFYLLKSDRDILLYCFLRSQRDYMDKGKYGGYDGKGTDFCKVYKWANLGGLGDVAKSDSQKRYEILKSLESLRQYGEISRYSLRDGKLTVWRARPGGQEDSIHSEGEHETRLSGTRFRKRMRRTPLSMPDATAHSSMLMTEEEFYSYHYDG